MRGTLYIMRGLPGSGKTTRALELTKDGGVIISHDDVLPPSRMARDGFDKDDWKLVYRTTDRRVKEALVRGVSPVVVDNSHITHVAFVEYIGWARRLGYEVEVVKTHDDELSDEDLANFALEGTHGVPLEKLRTMRARWQP